MNVNIFNTCKLLPRSQTAQIRFSTLTGMKFTIKWYLKFTKNDP